MLIQSMPIIVISHSVDLEQLQTALIPSARGIRLWKMIISLSLKSYATVRGQRPDTLRYRKAQHAQCEAKKRSFAFHTVNMHEKTSSHVGDLCVCTANPALHETSRSHRRKRNPLYQSLGSPWKSIPGANKYRNCERSAANARLPKRRLATHFKRNRTKHTHMP